MEVIRTFGSPNQSERWDRVGVAISNGQNEPTAFAIAHKYRLFIELQRRDLADSSTHAGRGARRPPCTKQTHRESRAPNTRGAKRTHRQFRPSNTRRAKRTHGIT